VTKWGARAGGLRPGKKTSHGEKWPTKNKKKKTRAGGERNAAEKEKRKRMGELPFKRQGATATKSTKKGKEGLTWWEKGWKSSTTDTEER